MYSPSADDARIIEAACSGNLELLQGLEVRFGGEDFRRKCNICKDCEGRRALHYAAENGFLHVCKFLIQKVEVDINIKNNIGNTPLLNAVAILGNNISAAKYLIIRNADIRMSDSKGMTCLHYAAEKDNRELMRMLLLRGANIESNSVRGTPLQCAASRGNVDSVRFLLHHGANPNAVSLLSHSPLVSAIFSRSSECLELLLKVGANPNTISCGLTPLSCAAIKGDAQALNSLLLAGANPNAVSTLLHHDHDMKPIEHAASVRSLDCVKILFPLTERIPSYPDWSIDGITNYFHTEEAKTKRERSRNDYFRLADQKGENAAMRKDYSAAVKWYSEAIYIDPSDAGVRSGRGICWAFLEEGVFALYDAEAWVELSHDDSPMARYSEGLAWMLLRNYFMASDALKRAYELDSQDKEIHLAYCFALGCFFHDVRESLPPETVNMYRRLFG